MQKYKSRPFRSLEESVQEVALVLDSVYSQI